MLASVSGGCEGWPGKPLTRSRIFVSNDFPLFSRFTSRILYLIRGAMAATLLELVADPIRLSVLRTLADRESAGLDEIAERAGVHPNTARPRLIELERAGAVERTSAPGP